MLAAHEDRVGIHVVVSHGEAIDLGSVDTLARIRLQNIEDCHLGLLGQPVADRSHGPALGVDLEGVRIGVGLPDGKKLSFLLAKGQDAGGVFLGGERVQAIDALCDVVGESVDISRLGQVSEPIKRIFVAECKFGDDALLLLLLVLVTVSAPAVLASTDNHGVFVRFVEEEVALDVDTAEGEVTLNEVTSLDDNFFWLRCVSTIFGGGTWNAKCAQCDSCLQEPAPSQELGGWRATGCAGLS